MSMNKLKLNDDKTEFLIMFSKYQQHIIQDHSINVGTTTIHASKIARNLGIVFDDNLCMDQHVKRVCQSVYFHIRNVNGIRKILTDETAATIIHALITSRIDNGNSLLTGITDRLIRKLQLAQNAAARILTKTRKFDHITPILKDPHWLPIRERIDFKILILTWKTLNGTAPEYLTIFLFLIFQIARFGLLINNYLLFHGFHLHLEIKLFQLLHPRFGTCYHWI